ncbi:MAG: HU family DNA-binding protein [Phycisphaerales bacterium]
MATITKKQLIERISERTKVKRADVRRSIQEFLDQVIAELKKGNRLEFRDFGVFEVKERAARVAQNPKTLERVTVPAKRTVKFKVGRLMRDSIELGSPEIHRTEQHKSEQHRAESHREVKLPVGAKVGA